MLGRNIHHTEPILLLLLVCVVILAAFAKKFKTPYPIVLVVAGAALAFLPRMPSVQLSPNLVFLLFLPPLLFSAAWQTSWRDFRFNLVSISMLAIGLVTFTVFGLALCTHWLIPSFDWHTGLVLGAVVCTTDAIAATAIADRVGLPRRIRDVIEGESLVNDASGLIALQIAISLLLTDHPVPLLTSLGMFTYLIVSSVAIGLAIGKVVAWVETKVDDAPIEITISLMTPYFAYLAGESAHSSGVLATVVAGLYLGHHSSLYFSTKARLESGAVWETLSFVFNGIVFILLGLQLPHIMNDVRALGLRTWFRTGIEFSLVVIVLRIIWVYPGGWASNWIRRRILKQAIPFPNPRALFVIGWSGMRGVVALAAAVSLPITMNDGSPFPERSIIIFLTFCVIFATLVGQGLTLPFVIRKLGLCSTTTVDPEEQTARYQMIEAALAYLDHAKEEDDAKYASVYDDLIRVQQHRINLLPGEHTAETGYTVDHYKRFVEAARNVQALQRAALLNLRNHNEINDEVLRRLEQELDVAEIRYAAANA
jgi:monovalent cation/hydrogen antiporter